MNANNKNEAAADLSAAEGLGPITLAALWFGASVSLAEVAVGGLLAEGGASLGMTANLAGHLAGALFFFAAGWISWKRGKKAVAVSADAFGRGGPVLFGLLNVVQLVGWTAVMIVVGSRSLGVVASPLLGFEAERLFRIVLGVLVLLWAGLGPRRIGKLNTAAALALGILCLAVSGLTILPLLASGPAAAAAGSAPKPAPAPVFPFGLGFELAVVMPLSWLPLVGDYVAGARRGRLSAWGSAAAYSAGSFWMYSIGLAAVLTAGTSDPVALMKGGWTAAALAVVLLSTVTTAFLDARSAGISLAAALPRVRERPAVLGAAAAGLLLALAAPVEQYENFLLLVGSVFAPLYAVVFADYLLRPRFAAEIPGRNLAAFLFWAVGVGAYHYLSASPTVLGTTVPVMGLVAALYCIYVLGVKKWKS